MSRQIRMSAAEAIAKGLIDPAVADLVGKGSKERKSKLKIATPAKVKAIGTPLSTSGEAAPEKPKKRSVSRPAVHPKASTGPAGHGSFTLDENGLVCAANLVFDLVPVPKERPRVVTNPETDKTFGFTPARTKYFTTEVARVVKHVFGSKPPIEGPVTLDMIFVIQVPKSWPKWKKNAALEGLIVPTGRPDMDNLEKALLDAFNETLIVDDAYVIDRRAKKIYGEMPMITTEVRQTGQFDINVRREALETYRRQFGANDE